jgi:type 1 fimbria pilin
MQRSKSNERTKRWPAALRICTGLFSIYCLASPALADCTVSGGVAGTATIALPNNLSAAHDRAVGSVIYDSNWVTAGPESVVCSGTSTLSYGYASPMVLMPGSTKVYQSGIDGIGIRGSWVNSMSGTPGMDEGYAMQSPQSTASVKSGNYGPMGRFRVQLIVMGPVSAGRLTLPATLATADYGGTVANVLKLTNNTAPVVAPSCSVQNSAIPVSMPKANVSSLTSVGSTTGDTGFQISLNCSGPVAVAVTFTDANAPENRGNTLSLSKASTAEGVAYQITHDSKPINYGPDSNVADNPSQFSVGQVNSAGVASIPFVARYIRTGPVKPGSADANATFTMNYQ